MPPPLPATSLVLSICPASQPSLYYGTDQGKIPSACLLQGILLLLSWRLLNTTCKFMWMLMHIHANVNYVKFMFRSPGAGNIVTLIKGSLREVILTTCLGLEGFQVCLWRNCYVRAAAFHPHHELWFNISQVPFISRTACLSLYPAFTCLLSSLPFVQCTFFIHYFFHF